MGIFKEILGNNETLFKNPVALDYDYIPKMIPFRENEQHQIASCIKPLFQKRNGRNIFIFGEPGIGKTVACKHILQELEDETDEIYTIYINCWKHNTTYKIALEMCDILGYKFTMNKKTEELFDIARDIVNKKAAVFVFDEIDKAEDMDFLYLALEEIYRKAVILITNSRENIISLDARIKSRLTAEVLEFRQYNPEEMKQILKERSESAFYPNVWKDDAFSLITAKAFELGDVRAGLYLMKEAANSAEDMASKEIRLDHVKNAINKLDEFYVKEKEALGEDEKTIMDIVKNNSGKKIGELYKIYTDGGGKYTYKTFQRRIAKLEQGKFVNIEKIEGGKEGKTTIVKNSSETKKLTEF
ncbi:MAG: AAA family ATPase [Candidatus Woesearchaeota archaeon]|nr:AAA family ATPase [Candidatus Woesearchaeota archaeon]